MHKTSRRTWLRSTIVGGIAAAVAGTSKPAAAHTRTPYKHSIASWCFESYWNIEQQAQVARRLGCASVELVPIEKWGTLKKYGLICAIAPVDLAPYPPFVKGWNNPRYRDEVLAATRRAIDACAEADFPNVIAFTGYKYVDVDKPSKGEIPLDEGIRNCISGLKQIVGYAERRGVTICLEMLNTRDDSHPMKGHPGYQGDHLHICVEIIQKIASPALKLLFDVYHVQIMDGDLIRRIHQLKEILGHIHTAGNPGRGELDENQEINYRPVMKALAEVGYTGYVGHEFLPTRDPLAGLKQAIEVCTV